MGLKETSKFQSSVKLLQNSLRIMKEKYNCLRKAGIKTVGDLTKRTQSDLRKVRNLGKNSLEEVIAKLKGLGLRLADG